MDMNLIEFTRLCNDASEQLGLEDTSALGFGVGVLFEGVAFETSFVEGQNSFLLFADLGAIAPDDRVSVYESLLTLQLTAWDEPRLRFGFHPMHDAAVLCVTATLGEKTDGGWLATLLKSVASQVAYWRRTVLAGRVNPRHKDEFVADAVI
jgi:hypothetical protein